MMWNKVSRRLLANLRWNMHYARNASTCDAIRGRSLPGRSMAERPSKLLAHGIHLFQCSDQLGIVATISQSIAVRGANIISVDIYIDFDDTTSPVFYSRRIVPRLDSLTLNGKHSYTSVDSEFAFDPLQWPRAMMDEDFAKISNAFNAQKSVVRVPGFDQDWKIAVLASWQDHCLVDLMHKWQEGELAIHIDRVISNHDRPPNTHVLRFLERHGIPYHYIPTSKGEKREEDILELVADTDFLVLARYMQVLSPKFLRRYGKDIINIHHGLLPSFKGANPYRQIVKAIQKQHEQSVSGTQFNRLGSSMSPLQDEALGQITMNTDTGSPHTLFFSVLSASCIGDEAYQAGVKLIGATSHFVTEELDDGPIIEQMVDRVSHRDTLHTFAVKSENLEKQCLAKAIKNYCELRVVRYSRNKTMVFVG